MRPGAPFIRVPAGDERLARSGTPEQVIGVPSRRSLAWRLFVANVAVLVGVSAFYILSPATISDPVAVSEAAILLGAVTVSLFVNLVLLDRLLGPLEQLRKLMQRVDPLEPGQRIALDGADADVTALADAFNAMLDRTETERRESARRALAAQEDERRRVARDLHDELGQTLTGVLLLLDEASRGRAPREAEALEEAREAARAAIDEVRRIVRDLRPEALDDLGVVSAIAALGSAFERHTGVPLERRLPGGLGDLSPEQELVLYRVLQEALTNVTRHAGAEHVELRVERVDGAVRATVSDDGVGFAGPAPEDGGIRGMRERALLVRGRVDVESGPGRGTEVVLTIPVHR
jgi:two-component system, NarL family, sensor histidine kinase UhpB